MPTPSALVRALELQKTEIKQHFSRQRIEVNPASSKQTSEKRFENLSKFATMLHECFFKINL
jgi:hypothetical protein